MDKKNILPQQGQPVIRMTAGKLPSHLAELSEEALGGNGAEAAFITICSYDGAEAAFITICSYDGAEAAFITICSYDGDDA
ncbi:DUF5837 family cyanobactin class RiPP [Crocosphaera sp. XPORK-15E]|uniref:DUF5837 family cyanobactin class RiPP n=1 Tax=Crocosphaera sp. XPORK-15E TaxID=3110247 RepID=UPI002B1EEE52|nr:DUF5837 family cyanobactin class RiPP [Crocosphaera sp. XPORK-15E]MEA5536881.1 DUF5837 family cyanobactin class RiPP [Crocosphaera sp. XPORK-15E]